MNIYLLIKCYEDGDSYQTFSDLDEARKVFTEDKEEGYYHTLVLCDIGPDQSFGFGSQGFYGNAVVAEWSRDYGDE